MIKFYRLSDKAVRVMHSDISDRLEIFVMDENGPSFTKIDPYLKVLQDPVGTESIPIVDLRSSIKNKTFYRCLNNYDWYPDSHFTQIDSESIFDGSYFDQFFTKEALEEYWPTYSEQNKYNAPYKLYQLTPEGKISIFADETMQVVEAERNITLRVNKYNTANYVANDFVEGKNWMGIVESEHQLPRLLSDDSVIAITDGTLIQTFLCKDSVKGQAGIAGPKWQLLNDGIKDSVLESYHSVNDFYVKKQAQFEAIKEQYGFE